MHLIVQQIRFGVVFKRARKFAVDEDLPAAMATLVAAFGEVAGHLDPAKAPVLAAMLFAKWCQSSQMPDAPVPAILSAAEAIHHDKDLSHFNKAYLLFYCKWLLALESKTGNDKAFEAARSIKVTSKDINFGFTSSVLKKWFEINYFDTPKIDQYLRPTMYEMR